MKKLITILTTLALLVNFSITASAANAVQPNASRNNIEIVDLGNGMTIEYEVTELPSIARASTKTAAKTATCKVNGVKVATIKLTATFSYTGSSATCTSASATYTMYDGWSASNKSTTRSGRTATTSAYLSKWPLHATPTTTMSCSNTGVIS